MNVPYFSAAFRKLVKLPEPRIVVLELGISNNFIPSLVVLSCCKGSPYVDFERRKALSRKNQG
jgi:hypothetical protein